MSLFLLFELEHLSSFSLEEKTCLGGNENTPLVIFDENLFFFDILMKILDRSLELLHQSCIVHGFVSGWYTPVFVVVVQLLWTLNEFWVGGQGSIIVGRLEHLHEVLVVPDLVVMVERGDVGPHRPEIGRQLLDNAPRIIDRQNINMSSRRKKKQEEKKNRVCTF